jgi:hypothetical protein
MSAPPAKMTALRLFFHHPYIGKRLVKKKLNLTAAVLWGITCGYTIPNAVKLSSGRYRHEPKFGIQSFVAA